MRNGLKVMDADAHVLYPFDLWSRFLDAPYKHRVVRTTIPGVDAYYPTLVDGRFSQLPRQLVASVMPTSGLPVEWGSEDRLRKYGALVTEGFTGDRVAKALEVEGVDLMVIFGPEFDMWPEGIDGELQAAMARAYNRWGQEMYEQSGGRVLTAGPIPLTDVSRAVQEIQYAYDHLGTRCFWARPNVVNHRNLGHRYYDPIYELLQDLDCAFATHEFQGYNGPAAGWDRFQTFAEWHTVVHPHEAQMAIVAMIAGGVFERFPRLRCGYMEAGCGWLPSLLHRLDEHLEMTGGHEKHGLTMEATEYFGRNGYIAAECADPYVTDVIRWLGDDHIVFETDFPHPDSKYPHVVETFLKLLPDQLSMDSKRKILWDNAVDLYRFPTDYLPSQFLETAAPVAV
jgi:predicted TIM-barrel fold metal-dependent hydrolase